MSIDAVRREAPATLCEFDPAMVEQEIEATIFAGNVRHFASVGSTNVLALEAAQAGERSGVWVADEQTAGRGRGGHGWHSASGEGLYVSVLVTPPLPMSRALWLSLATGLTAKAAIAQQTGLDIDIRWPNDLMLNGRKCGGILVETAAAPDRAREAMLRYAVIGVGINVNHAEFGGELRNVATSLRMELKAQVARGPLLAALLRALNEEIQCIIDGSAERDDEDGLLSRMAKASSWVQGKRVKVEEGDGYTGVTDGLDERGFLRVAGDDGVLHTVLSGGVREI